MKQLLILWLQILGFMALVVVVLALVQGWDHRDAKRTAPPQFAKMT